MNSLIKSAKAVVNEESLFESGLAQLPTLAQDNIDSKKVGSILEKSISNRDRFISMAAQEWAKAIFLGELYGWKLNQDQTDPGSFKDFINSKKWDRNSLKKDREFQDALEWVNDDLIKEVSKNLSKIKI